MAVGKVLAKRPRSGGKLSRPVPIVLTLLFLFGTSTIRADDWVTGNGGRPERNGLTTEHGPTAARVLWDQCPHASDYGGFAPVIGAGIVVSSRVGNSPDIVHGTWLVAQNLETGAEVWSVQLPINFPDSWWSDVLAIRDGHVYATRAGNGNTNHEYLYALDPADGSVIWPSEALIDLGGAETPSFTSNGDLVVGQFSSILRIDHTDGSTVWQTPRLCLAECEAAVLDDRVYTWEGIDTTGGIEYVVGVYDAADGHRLYGSTPLRTQFFGINQIGLLLGADGTIYAPMSNNTPGDALIALEDTGAALVEKWRFPLGYVPFSNFSVGPDGSVYATSTDSEVVRLDAADGNVLNTSLPIPWDASAFFARLAVDARGRVFLNNGAVSLGALYAFDPDLRLRWSDTMPGITFGGPAIGPDGTLVVAGFGTVRAYRTRFSGDTPFRVDEHVGSTTSSNGNGVLEPGETVLIEPTWENGNDSQAALFSTSVLLTGPGDGVYSIDDAGAEYGTIPAGGSSNCFDATGTCPRMTIGVPSVRPATHWDAAFDEAPSLDVERSWTLHVGGSFSDVPGSNLFYRHVETVLHNGVTAGCGSATYCPNAGVTRAQMAVFLLKSRHGADFVPPPASGALFDDVPANAFAAAWIEELAVEGITGGCSEGPPLYCPDAPVTRAQMAVFLLKMEHGKRFVPPACTGHFDDVACPGAFAVDWIERLAQEGVTAGCGPSLYCPDDPNTRGQMAAFLTRAFGLALYGP